MGCLGHQPLQDAGVFPARGDQVTVVVQEGNVGHVTAVTAVLVARSLEGRIKKTGNLSNTGNVPPLGTTTRFSQKKSA